MIPAKYLGATKVFALALVVIVVSAVVSWLASASVQVANEGRAEVGGTVSFEGEARRYEVLLSYRAGQGSYTPERMARYVKCDVASSGDRYAHLDGARQGTFRVTDVGASIGSFDGREGPLSVSCEWSTRSGNHRFIVAKERKLSRSFSYAGFGLGGVLVIAGLLMVRRASRRP